MNAPTVEVSGLWHRYARDWALKDISFELQARGVIGLLGSNGAGKSTLMGILCGCLSQTRGIARVSGLDIREHPLVARQKIGFLPQQAPLSHELTIEEYVRFCAYLRKVPKDRVQAAVDFVIDRCGLNEMRRRLIGNLSGGYRQRVGVAQALVHRPQLIVMDEPTVGLDPNQIDGLRDLIREVGQEHTVVFSTHTLSEVEALCRDVLMIERGEVVFHGEIGSFRELSAPQSVLLVCQRAPSKASILDAHESIIDVDIVSPSTLRLRTDGDRSVTRLLIGRGEQDGWGIEEIGYEKTSLEDVFRSLSNGAAS